MFGAANRDERAFPEPDRLNPYRENVREHLAFGQGNHYCIGAGLARLEGSIALDVLLDRWKDVRFAPGKNDRWMPLRTSLPPGKTFLRSCIVKMYW